MKVQFIALVLLISALFSCSRKEYASFRQIPVSRGTVTTRALPENSENVSLLQPLNETNTITSRVDKKLFSETKKQCRKKL